MTSTSAALVLSAGGARGAYQAGALLFLAEQGMTFNAVAGAGIGALNGAYYVQGDGSVGYIQGLIEHWRVIPEVGILRVSSEALTKLLFLEDSSAVQGLAEGDYALLDPAPVAKLLDNWLNYEKVSTSPITLTVVALSEIAPILDLVMGTWRKARYFRAQELSPAKLRQVLLASTAMPLVFPAQEVEEEKFSSAGLVDPLPAQVLYQDGARLIVSVFLSDSTIQNRADFPGCTIFQIRPSVTIHTGLVSTIDFSRQTIDRLIDLGYRDARDSYKEAQDILIKGRTLHEQGNRIENLANKLPERKDVGEAS